MRMLVKGIDGTFAEVDYDKERVYLGVQEGDLACVAELTPENAEIVGRQLIMVARRIEK